MFIGLVYIKWTKYAQGVKMSNRPSKKNVLMGHLQGCYAPSLQRPKIDVSNFRRTFGVQRKFTGIQKLVSKTTLCASKIQLNYVQKKNYEIDSDVTVQMRVKN